MNLRGAFSSGFFIVGFFIVAFAVLLGTATEAKASPFDLYGSGSRAGARAGAMTASADDHTALYYNPAGMLLGKPMVSVGTLVAMDDVRIRLKKRPTGYDLPDRGDGSAAIPSKFRLNKRTDTDDITNTYGLQLGATASLGNENLRVGVNVMLPMNRIARQVSRFPDEREQYFSNRLDFEMLGERSQQPAILAGIAYRFSKYFSIGAGVNVLPGADTVASVYLADATKQQEIELVVENDQVGRVAPTIGLLVTPSESLRFGLSYRGANYFKLKLRNDIQIMGFQGEDADFPVTQQATVVANYSPDQLAAGVVWQSGSLAASLDAVWMRWSGYLNYQGSSDHGFSDAISVRASLEKGAASDTKLRVGLAWEPSGVPLQDGRTNYVDNDRFVGSIGGGHPFVLFGKALELSWYAQLHYLVPIDVNKTVAASYPECDAQQKALCDELPDDAPRADTGQQTAWHTGLQTGNPGFPGWQSWGTLLAIGADLRWRF
jgi:long-chain fatty acid transport protein